MAETVRIPTTSLSVGSPEWYVDRLAWTLNTRKAQMKRLRAYAAGLSDDPLVSDRASIAFQRIMGLSKTNLCGLVISSVQDRLSVSGFRFGDIPEADADAWRIWQTSDFDQGSELAIGAALTNARSFVSVEPGPTEGDMPRLYAEDPTQVIVAYEAGNYRKRVAALKIWGDEWTGESRANLYLPDRIHRFSTKGLFDAVNTDIFPTRWESMDDFKNPLGEVPIYELRNRPSIDGSVMAEHEDILADQDRANHIALNALIAAEYGAFRQKWVSGLEIPRDPATGLPIEPFDVAVNRILVAEDPGARFGDFNPTDLEPYISLYESTVRHMAAVSRTPAAYMLGHIANLSAEALAAAEAGLVMKSDARRRGYNGGIEDMMRAAFRAMGDPRADEQAVETTWVSAEIKSDAALADRAVKLTQGDRPIIPVEQAQEDLGYTETQRARMKQWQSDGDTLGAFAATLQAQVDSLNAPTSLPVANVP